MFALQPEMKVFSGSANRDLADVTRQRYDGFKKTIQEDYPDIKIVEEQGIGGPDFSGDAEKAA